MAKVSFMPVESIRPFYGEEITSEELRELLVEEDDSLRNGAIQRAISGYESGEKTLSRALVEILAVYCSE